LADVIIVGGGVAGCSTAWYLAADGADVLLLERGDLNAMASGANAGSLHAQIQQEPYTQRGESWVREFLPALPFYRYTIDLWEQAAARLGPELEFAREGGIIVAFSDAQMRHVESKAAIEQAAGLGTELLDREALRRIAPYIADAAVGGARCPLEGKANPLHAAPLFAAAARAQGADVRCDCEVTGISRAHGVYTVHTNSGAFRAPCVVDAAGIDVGRVAAMVGGRLVIRAYAIQLSVTEPVEPLVKHLVYATEDMLTLKQTCAGTVLIGGGWPARIDTRGRPQVRAESLSRNLALAMRVVPALADLLVVRTWAAAVNGTDSWLPILGELPGSPGFFINYVPWMGFTGGPGGGRIVASLVGGKPPPVDFNLDAFCPGAQ